MWHVDCKYIQMIFNFKYWFCLLMQWHKQNTIQQHVFIVKNSVTARQRAYQCENLVPASSNLKLVKTANNWLISHQCAEDIHSQKTGFLVILYIIKFQETNLNLNQDSNSDLQISSLALYPGSPASSPSNSPLVMYKGTNYKVCFH